MFVFVDNGYISFREYVDNCNVSYLTTIVMTKYFLTELLIGILLYLIGLAVCVWLQRELNVL